MEENTFLIQCKTICKCLQGLTVANQWSDLEQAKRRRDRIQGGRGCAEHIFTLCMWHRPFLWSLLQRDRENCEHLKYFRNVYCVMTNYSKDQDTWTNHKTTTVINVLACRLVFSRARVASPADIFPIWPRFLPFSPTAEPGPKLTVIRNLSSQYALRGICC